ncbi:hypothetical protein [Methanosarcina spelaei]|nr:hypothetical protein [Methanosarcina spelaei]
MAMRKLLFILSVILIFFCSIGTVFGINPTDNISVQSGDYLNSEMSNVNFDYYHEFFGLNSYGNTVIARYGKLPVLETMEQKKSWNSTLEKLSNKIKDTIASKYMYPHGQVVTCGVNDKGYFVILFKYGNVDKSLMNEIYALIDNSARGMGILGIPVEFGYGTYIKADIPLSTDVKNLSESENHFIEEYMKQKHEPVYKGGDIANYGTIPLFKDENEYNVWANKLDLIYKRVGEKIDAYMDKGQLRSFGLELTRLQVGIPENISSEEKMTISKEIYPIIDEEARKLNLTDFPVAFQSVGNYTDVIANSNGNLTTNSNGNLTTNSNGNLTTNSNGNLTTNSNGNKSSDKKVTPGFGLLGNFICLYGGWKFRKK